MNNKEFNDYLKNLAVTHDILMHSSEINDSDKNDLRRLFSMIKVNTKLAIFNDVLANNQTRREALNAIDDKITSLNREFDSFMSIETSKLFNGEVDKISARNLLINKKSYERVYDALSDNAFDDYSKSIAGFDNGIDLIKVCCEDLIPGYNNCPTFFGKTLFNKNIFFKF